MPEFQRAIRKSDIPEGGAATVEIAGCEIAIFHLRAGIYAIENRCLHQGGPLAEGTIEGCEVICPWHAWRYNIKTGRNDFDPGIRVRSFPVKVEAGEVYVGIVPG